MKRGVIRIRIAWVLLAGLLAGGLALQRNPEPTRVAERPRGAIVLATTTSVQDSGLLDQLLPAFERKTAVYVRPLAVGSGRALELARLGEADVVLSHSPELEDEFVREGYARERLPFASNDYVLVGPGSDPARTKGSPSAAEAFRRIASARSRFVSRGDGSGTNRKEKEFWRQAGVDPGGEWYGRANAGMGAVLRLCDERRAYTLVDRATYTTYRSRVDLGIMHEGAPELANPYSVLVVSSARSQRTGGPAAAELREFLTGPEGQRIVAGFGAREHGQPLFRPAGS